MKKMALQILLVIVILLGLLTQVQALPPGKLEGTEWVPFYSSHTDAAEAAVGATQGKTITFYYLKKPKPFLMYGAISVRIYCDDGRRYIDPSMASQIKLSYSKEDGWRWATHLSTSWSPINKGSPLHFLLKALKNDHPDWFRNKGI